VILIVGVLEQIVLTDVIYHEGLSVSARIAILQSDSVELGKLDLPFDFYSIHYSIC
jgi:hypothetical protein